MAKEISQSARVHVGNKNSASARRLWGQFKRKLQSQPCRLSPLLHASVAPNKVPVFTRRSAVTQMSRPSQPKVTSSDPNGVSVIQSQSHASAAPAPPQQVPQLVPAPPSSPGRKAAAPGKMKKAPADKDSDEYRQRRERNNLAVKKSRQRSKQKAMDTQQRVNQLKEENERLEAKIKLLSKELSVLKDLFLEHAHNLADNVQPPSGNPAASPAPNNQ